MVIQKIKMVNNNGLVGWDVIKVVAKTPHEKGCNPKFKFSDTPKTQNGVFGLVYYKEGSLIDGGRITRHHILDWDKLLNPLWGKFREYLGGITIYQEYDHLKKDNVPNEVCQSLKSFDQYINGVLQNLPEDSSLMIEDLCPIFAWNPGNLALGPSPEFRGLSDPGKEPILDYINDNVESIVKFKNIVFNSSNYKALESGLNDLKKKLISTCKVLGIQQEYWIRCERQDLISIAHECITVLTQLNDSLMTTDLEESRSKALGQLSNYNKAVRKFDSELPQISGMNTGAVRKATSNIDIGKCEDLMLEIISKLDSKDPIFEAQKQMNEIMKNEIITKENICYIALLWKEFWDSWTDVYKIGYRVFSWEKDSNDNYVPQEYKHNLSFNSQENYAEVKKSTNLSKNSGKKRN